jgi:hypothetical protein
MIAICGALSTAALHAQTLEDRLKSVRENIDTHAITRTDDPPAGSTETKWHVSKADGCTLELVQSWHHAATDGAVNSAGVFDLAEDKIVTWSFDLNALRPLDVVADSSAGIPHLLIYASGDVFHLKTDFTTKMLRKDGTVFHTSTWSAPANDRTLWMFFNSPDVDNKATVQSVETGLRDAVRHCAGAKLFTKGDNSRHARQVAREFETNP